MADPGITEGRHGEFGPVCKTTKLDLVNSGTDVGKDITMKYVKTNTNVKTTSASKDILKGV